MRNDTLEKERRREGKGRIAFGMRGQFYSDLIHIHFTMP